MITKRTMGLLTFSLVLSAIAAYIANAWIQKELGKGDELAKSMNQVVVSSVKIPFGLEIGESHIKLIAMPKDSIPAGAYTNSAEVIGKISKTDIYPGEIIIESRIVDHQGGSTLAALIAPNMRAITVRVNDVVGVAGFLLPGNRVDVISTKVINKNAISKTILRDIKVLAVDQTAATEKDEPIVVRSVTLEMSPDETEILTNATREGTLQLTLRNPTEEKTDEEVAVKEDKQPPIKSIRKVAKKPNSAEKQNSTVSRNITIIRGTKTEEQKTDLILNQNGSNNQDIVETADAR